MLFTLKNSFSRCKRTHFNIITIIWLKFRFVSALNADSGVKNMLNAKRVGNAAMLNECNLTRSQMCRIKISVNFPHIDATRRWLAFALCHIRNCFSRNLISRAGSPNIESVFVLPSAYHVCNTRIRMQFHQVYLNACTYWSKKAQTTHAAPSWQLCSIDMKWSNWSFESGEQIIWS